VMTGGGALLRGLDRRFGEEPGMPVLIAEAPLLCVAGGSAMLAESLSKYRRLLTSQRRIGA